MMIRNSLLLLLTLTLAAPAWARRHAEYFSEAVEDTKRDIENIDKLQRAAEGPFLKVGPRCLNNWEKVGSPGTELEFAL